MAINTQKVLVGGFAAGVVLNIIDFLTYGMVLKDRMAADMNAFKAGLGDQMAVMDGGSIAMYLIMDFIVGFLIIWAYAAMRPRFGAGAKTAIYVAVAFWIFGMITTSGFMHIGLMSPGLWWTFSFIWLVNLVLATLVGGRLYTEESAG